MSSGCAANRSAAVGHHPLAETRHDSHSPIGTLRPEVYAARRGCV
jgi:hypothetical protein